MKSSFAIRKVDIFFKIYLFDNFQTLSHKRIKKSIIFFPKYYYIILYLSIGYFAVS